MIALNALHFQPYRFIAHIAQLVEHFLGKEEVTGSNPVVGSISRAGLKVRGHRRQGENSREIAVCERVFCGKFQHRIAKSANF